MMFQTVPRRCALLLALLLAIPLLAAAQNPFAEQDSSYSGSGQSGGEFPPVDKAFPFTTYSDNGDLVLDWEVTPGFYIYQGRMKVEVRPEGVVAAEPEFSIESKQKKDPYFGSVQVLEKDFTATLEQLDGSSGAVRVNVEWQGCAEAGLCYPPQNETIEYNPSTGELLYPAPGDDGQSGSGSTTTAPGPDQGRAPDAVRKQLEGTASAGAGGAIQTQTGRLQNLLQSDSLVLSALIFYALGLGLTFTPCVLPMIPIITAVVAGQRQLSTLQAFYLSVAYVLGMAITYTFAGVLVGMLGASFNVQAYLQSPWVLGAFAGLFVLFAVVMFGIVELRIPRALEERLTRHSQKLSGGNIAGVTGIGALSALIVSPCVTAPLAAALVYISATQDALMGGHALLWLSLGMGTPLIVIGTGGQRFMPQPGPWMNRIKAAFGIMMLAVAIWLVERVLPGPVALALWAVLLAVTGVQLGAFEPNEPGWPRTFKGVGLILFLGGAMLLAGAFAGASDPLRPLSPFQAGSGGPAGTSSSHDELFERIDDSSRVSARLQQASANGKPVILDFYADWCISCRVMERNVFSDPEVRQTLSRYATIQVDVTDNNNSDQALLDRYGLFGPPSILFFDASGDEIRSARILGEMERAEFLRHLRSIRDYTGA